MNVEALLALEDGSLFPGRSIGARGVSTGEVVFNTAMTGYQEILTDPSYCRQIVALTYPHIGNVGANTEDEESRGIFASGLVVRDVPALASNWRSQSSLSSCLERHGVVGVAGVDTRRLTRLLREKGALAGAIVAGSDLDAQAAVAEARSFPGLAGMDLARVVSIEQPYEWASGPWTGERGFRTPDPGALPWRVIAYDFGIKRNILRALVSRGCRVEVMPAQTPARDVLSPIAAWGVPLEWSRRSGAVRLRHRSDPASARARRANLRDLSGAPVACARERRENDEDEVRSSRGEPSGDASRVRPDTHHQPEPRIRSRGIEPSRQPRRHPPLIVRWHDSRSSPYRRPGVRLPGSSRGEPGSTRFLSPVRPIHRADGGSHRVRICCRTGSPAGSPRKALKMAWRTGGTSDRERKRARAGKRHEPERNDDQAPGASASAAGSASKPA